MARSSHVFLASLLLTLAINGLDFSADARLAEWTAPIEPTATPMNLSGSSAGKLFDYAKLPSPNVASPLNLSGGSVSPTATPMNLSGNSVGELFEYAMLPSPKVASTLNLSGNSVGQLFEYSRVPSPNVASPLNFSGGSVSPTATPMNLSGNSVGKLFEYAMLPFPKVASTLNLSGGYESPLGSPGFDVINNVAQVIFLQCYNDAIPPPRKWLVLQSVNPGQNLVWYLDTIDPTNPHVSYRCNWMMPNMEQVISHQAWVDLENKNKLPFHCVFCTWKVSADGLYLLDPNLKTWTKVSHWGF